MIQRIVGVGVLVVLLAILLPLLLDLGGEYTMDTRSQIPARPNIVPVQIDEPAPIETHEGAKTADQMFRFDDSREQAGEAQAKWLAERPPKLTDKGIPESWVLQIASFSDQDKAQSLTDKLLADDYRAFFRRAVVEGETIHRVYVGPKILKKDLLYEKAAIEKKYQMKVLLLRFAP